YHGDTQMIISLMSSDKKNPSDSIACLAASAALAVSGIPFAGPVSEGRVARINGRFKVNPEMGEMELADMDPIVPGTERDVLMVEGEMKEVQEADMIEAIKVAHEVIQMQCKALAEFGAAVAKSQPKRTYDHEAVNPELEKRIHEFCYQRYYDLAMNPSSKEERGQNFKQVKDDFMATLTEEEVLVADKAMLARYF